MSRLARIPRPRRMPWLARAPRVPGVAQVREVPRVDGAVPVPGGLAGRPGYGVHNVTVQMPSPIAGVSSATAAQLSGPQPVATKAAHTTRPVRARPKCPYSTRGDRPSRTERCRRRAPWVTRERSMYAPMPAVNSQLRRVASPSAPLCAEGAAVSTVSTRQSALSSRARPGQSGSGPVRTGGPAAQEHEREEPGGEHQEG